MCVRVTFVSTGRILAKFNNVKNDMYRFSVALIFANESREANKNQYYAIRLQIIYATRGILGVLVLVYKTHE